MFEIEFLELCQFCRTDLSRRSHFSNSSLPGDRNTVCPSFPAREVAVIMFLPAREIIFLPAREVGVIISSSQPGRWA